MKKSYVLHASTVGDGTIIIFKNEPRNKSFVTVFKTVVITESYLRELIKNKKAHCLLVGCG